MKNSTGDIDALRRLLAAAEREDDLADYLKAIIAECGAEPDYLSRLAAVLAEQVARYNADILKSSQLTRCYFCMRSKDHVRYLVVARNAGICDACIRLAAAVLPPRRRVVAGLFRLLKKRDGGTVADSSHSDVK